MSSHCTPPSALLHSSQNQALCPNPPCPSTTSTSSLLNSTTTPLHDFDEPTHPQTYSKKNRAFFRIDGKRPSASHLMTPPSTPASSLRNTSFGTNISDVGRTSAFDSDEGLTRFLLVTNVPKNVKSVKDFIHALVWPDQTTASTLPAHEQSQVGKAGNVGNDCHPVKTIIRPGSKPGVVVVFYDLRDAQKVKRFVETGDGLNEQNDKLTCEYLAPEDMKKMGLDPEVYESTSGRFYVSVAPSAASTPSPEQTHTDVSLLESILAGIGHLMLFQLEWESADHEQVFLVDYFDVRCADDAFASLSAKKALCGMNLDLSRTKPHDRGTLAYQPTEISIDTSQLSKYVSFPTPPDTANTREMQLPAVGRFRNDQTQASNVNHGRRRFCDSPKTTSDHDMPQLVLQQPQDLSARRPSNSHLFDSTETAAKFENISARRPRSLSFDQTSVGDTSAASISGSTIPITREQAPILTSNYKYGMTVSGEQERDLDNDTYYVTPQHSSQSPAPTSYFPPYTFPPPPPSVNRSFDMRLSVGGAPVFDVFPRYPQDGSFTPFQPVQPHSSAQEAYYGPALTLPGIFYPQVPQMPMQYPLTASHPMPVVSMDDVRARLGEMRLSPLSASLYHVHPPPPTMHVGPEQASPGASSGFYRSRRQHAHSLQRERSSPERNQLNIAAIEEGRDMRTTVMVKNIPNRMTDEDLERFIAQVCARRIDFMYLRMDFKNGCNVGYAFVNFITVQDLLKFAKARLGVKWNMYYSDKVLQMSYANYQGKEALVEKFKNSCIMDERPSWRPKIFHSDGPNVGLPEDFPQPTHWKRRERSAHNRGMLYTPGLNSRAGSSSRHLHNQGSARR